MRNIKDLSDHKCSRRIWQFCLFFSNIDVTVKLLTSNLETTKKNVAVGQKGLKPVLNEGVG